MPYGATKYQEDTERFHESFWDNDGNVWVIGIREKWIKEAFSIPESLVPLPEEPSLDIKWEDAPTDTAVWIVDNRSDPKVSDWYEEVGARGTTYAKISGAHTYLTTKDSESITIHHRPEQPMPPKAEWMPEVGEECVVSYPYEDGNFKCFDGEKVLIISCGRCEMTSEYVYTGHNAKHGYVALSAKGYRPLKTSEEKKREYNYGEILKILNLIHSSDFCPVEAASVLAHEGFTAPEGEL